MGKESLTNLKNYCKKNKRICPMPVFWNELWNKLKNKKKINNKWMPAAPLILAVWYDTPAIMKQIRFMTHLEWASENNQLEEISGLLKSLKEHQWFHFDD